MRSRTPRRRRSSSAPARSRRTSSASSFRLAESVLAVSARDITVLLGGNHRIDWVTTYPFSEAFSKEFGAPDIQGHPSTNGDVIIGNDVWVGRGVTIMSGVTIGDGAVIATNATVVKDVEPYSVAGGNPARLIKMRFDEDIIERLLILKWWELPLDDIRKIIQDAPHYLKPNGWLMLATHCMNLR